MGKIGQGILGGLSGKVGNIIGASWKGIHYIRIKPTSVANPRTVGQVNQRLKFAAVQAFLKPNRAFVKLGYRFHQNKRSAMNAATSYLLQNAITGTAPDFTVDYSTALLSQGDLDGAPEATAVVSGNDVIFSWPNNSVEGSALPNDQAMLLVYNPTKKRSVAVLQAGIQRDTMEGTVTVPTTYTSDPLEFFMAFRSADGKAVSDSVHVGSGIIV